MSDNRPVETQIEKSKYNSLAACINHNYCMVNQYDFIYYQPYYKEIDLNSILNCADPTNGEMRHSSWSKLLSIYISLKMDYDYVVYIDSDAIFRTTNYTIENFIDKHLGNNDFIFLDNSPNPDVHIEKSACAGFMVIRNNDKSKNDIYNWYHTNHPGCNNNYFYEQSALWWFNQEKMNVSIATEKHFHEQEGQFVRHLHSGIMGIRMEYLTNVLSEQGLNLENNSKITHISFDTSQLYGNIFPTTI